MSIKPKDPLLTAGKVMTKLLMAFTALATLFLTCLIPILLFKQAEFAEKVIEGGGDNVGMAMAVSIIGLLMVAALAAAVFHFFQLLGRIIDTVSVNDPFTSENASRLSRMGWIALAFQIATFPIAAVAVYLAEFVPAEELSVDFEFSLTGILMAIVLFILARVFKNGAAMREDLEGTV